jgi:phosphopantothenoylcysteine decarboxylase/phosphopantothenate--cysteine ligase
VVISGGGTVEKIDEVRYLSNFSSGKMAASLALAAYLQGASVRLVSTRGYEQLPKAIDIDAIQSSEEMFLQLQSALQTAKKESSKTPYLFKAAAVSDYVPKQAHTGKLKKEVLKSNWSLELSQNKDVLTALDKKGLIAVGFKAEMDEKSAQNSAVSMLDKKELDGVCLNILNQENPFGSDSNNIELFLKKTKKSFRFEGNKLMISLQLLEQLKDVFNDQ